MVGSKNVGQDTESPAERSLPEHCCQQLDSTRIVPLLRLGERATGKADRPLANLRVLLRKDRRDPRRQNCRISGEDHR